MLYFFVSRKDIIVIFAYHQTHKDTINYGLRVFNYSACAAFSKFANVQCFGGDTRIALTDGTSPTLKEMIKRYENGEFFWGYGVDNNGRIIVVELQNPRCTGRSQLIEVTLDSNEKVRCTEDHQFLLRNGKWEIAMNLEHGTPLMPLYRKLHRRYDSVYQPNLGYMETIYRLADEWNLKNGVYENSVNTHRHHKDFNRMNNNPSNIERISASEHIRIHNEIYYGEGFDSDEHGKLISDAIGRLSQDPQWLLKFSESQQKKSLDFWYSDSHQDKRKALIEGRKNPSDTTREAHRKATKQRFQDPEEKIRHSARMKKIWEGNNERRERQANTARNINIRNDITSDLVIDALNKAGTIRGAARLLDCDRSVFRRFPDELEAFRNRSTFNNHKVSDVKQISGVHDTYCLTVPETQNFALESGVFVHHNCAVPCMLPVGTSS